MDPCLEAPKTKSKAMEERKSETEIVPIQDLEMLHLGIRKSQHGQFESVS